MKSKHQVIYVFNATTGSVLTVSINKMDLWRWYSSPRYVKDKKNQLPVDNEEELDNGKYNTEQGHLP